MARIDALSIEEISKKFSGKICFESHADIQSTLVNGDVEKIREEVMLLLRYIQQELPFWVFM